MGREDRRQEESRRGPGRLAPVPTAVARRPESRGQRQTSRKPGRRHLDLRCAPGGTHQAHLRRQQQPPVWSPDGKRVVFSADAQGSSNLYVVNAGGSGKPERLTKSDYSQIPSSWDRTTGMLAFLQRPTLETTGIWILPVDGRPATPKLFLESRFVLSHAEFSPDGRWIAHASNESGGTEVYVQPYPAPARRSAFPQIQPRAERSRCGRRMVGSCSIAASDRMVA